MASPSASSPRIGVALGGGAARGLAHIPFIEAMDELGLKPARIAGTSIGALIGVGWAAGLSGAEIRAHALSVLGSLQMIAGRLWTTHRPTLEKFMQQGLPMQAEPELIVAAFLPDDFPDDFAALEIPFAVTAADVHTWQTVHYDTGPLRQAVAASIAIPALFKPVAFGGRLLLDGGVTTPLPLDLAARDADILVGIDVTGTPDGRFRGASPNPIDIGVIAAQIMAKSLIACMAERHPPDILVEPAVNPFGPFEFLRVADIVSAAEPQTDDFKRRLTAAIEAFESK